MNKRIVYLLVLVIFGVFIVDQAGIYSVTGGTVLSLDSATFSSSSDFFTGENFIITMAQGGLSQSIEGYVTSGDIKDETDKSVRNDFSIDITNSEQSCNYPIETNPYKSPIYDYTLVEWSCGWYDESEAVDNCGEDYYVAGKYSASFTCFCVDRTKVTGAISYDTIENPNVQTISDIEVSNGDETSTETFDTEGKIKGYIGDNVYVTWNGDLMRDSCPNQAPYYGFYENGEWNLGDKTLYDNYRTIANDYRTAEHLWSSSSDAEDSVDTLNYYSGWARNTVEFGEIENPSSLDSAVIEKNLESGVTVPTWTFIVDADYLEIYQPIGDPNIVSASSSTFKAGANGKIVYEIRNDGEGRGSFDVYADCNSPFRMTGNTKTYNVDAGDSVSDFIEISADTDESITDSCALYADGVESSDSQRVEVSVDPQQVCEPSVQNCVAGDIQECNSEGSGYEVVEECKVGCTYENGEPICEEDIDDDDDDDYKCPWWNPFCDLFPDFQLPDLGGLAFYGRLLMGLVGGILGFLSLSKITTRVSKNQWISLGVPTGAAVVMFALAWTPLWAFALILTIVWGIVEFVV